MSNTIQWLLLFLVTVSVFLISFLLVRVLKLEGLQTAKGKASLKRKNRNSKKWKQSAENLPNFFKLAMSSRFRKITDRVPHLSKKKRKRRKDEKISFRTFRRVVKGKIIHGDKHFQIKHITDYPQYLKKPSTVLFLREPLTEEEWSRILENTPAVIVFEEEMTPSIFYPQVTYVRVKNFHKSYWNFINYYRKIHRIPVFAITGTCGKTTTKEMIMHILKKDYNVHGTRSSNNSFYHNFTYLCGLSSDTEAAVFETPVGHPGLLEYHCKFFQPTIGMITNIGIDHLKQCGDLETYVQAKGEILTGLKNKGILILNSDDEKTKQISLNNYKGKVVYFGIHNSAEYKASNIRYREGGMRFTLNYGSKRTDILVPGYGEHQVYNALAAITAVHQAGFDIQKAKERLRSFSNLTGHCETFEGFNGATIVNDTWSSNPTSIEAALKAFEMIGAEKHKIAVVGSISLLGDEEKRLHEEVGKMIVDYPVNTLFTFGPFSKEIARGAKGLKGKIIKCDKANEVEKYLLPMLNRDCAVLIKASMYDHSVSSLLKKLKENRNKGKK